MKAVIVAFVPVLLVLALVLPGLRLARRPLELWTRGLAALLGMLAVVLVVFLFSEDDYRRDGRSNWSVYHVEYVAVPTVIGALAAAVWLRRKEGTAAAALVSPLLALGFSAAAYGCLVLTVN